MTTPMKESVSAWPNSSPAFRPDTNPEADRKIRVAFVEDDDEVGWFLACSRQGQPTTTALVLPSTTSAPKWTTTENSEAVSMTTDALGDYQIPRTTGCGSPGCGRSISIYVVLAAHF
jgi:hypothetical protein